MTLTTACIESWPVTIFWSWIAVSVGFILGAWWAGGRGEGDDDKPRVWTARNPNGVDVDKHIRVSARQRGEGVE